MKETIFLECTTDIHHLSKKQQIKLIVEIIFRNSVTHIACDVSDRDFG